MIAAVITALLPVLPSVLVSFIGGISAAHKAQADQIINDRNARRDERVARTKAIADVQVAEGGRSILNPLMRFYIAFGPATYLFKIFVFDKVLCPPLGLACTTDPLSPELWDVVKATVGFYLLAETGIATGRAIAGAIARRK